MWIGCTAHPTPSSQHVRHNFRRFHLIRRRLISCEKVSSWIRNYRESLYFVLLLLFRNYSNANILCLYQQFVRLSLVVCACVLFLHSEEDDASEAVVRSETWRQSMEERDFGALIEDHLRLEGRSSAGWGLLLDGCLNSPHPPVKGKTHTKSFLSTFCIMSHSWMKMSGWVWKPTVGQIEG